MKQLTHMLRGRGAAGAVLALLLAMAHAARAGEIESLAWEPGTDLPTLQIRVRGASTYEAQILEDGHRLRVGFPDSTMGPALTELPGQGSVKGVYPYLSESGTVVNVDLLLTDAARLQVKRTGDGYRVTAQPASAAQPQEAEAPPTAMAPPAPEVPVMVAVPAAPTAAAAVAAKAAAPEPNAIEDILYTKLAGDRIQITLKMTGPPQEPQAFTITNPARISLDFPNTRAALARKSVAVQMGSVNNVTAVESESRTRIVLSLVSPASYRTGIVDNNFVITLEAPVAAAAGAGRPRTTHFASSRRTGRYSLKGIDFRRGPQGDAKIIVELSDPAVGIDIREQAGEIVLDFQDTTTPPELQRRLDVVDFATPVQLIDTFVQGKNTRMVIAPKGKYEHIAYQSGTVLTLSVKPVVEKVDEKKVDEFGYSGEKLSLNFQNIEARAALQVLADFTGLNFVVADTVRGSLTLRLKDVPWDQALDLIVDAKGLAVRRRGNVVVVAPAAEVAAKEKAGFEASKAALELEPLATELIQINYAKAEEIANLLKSIKALTTSIGQHPVFGPSGAGGGTSVTQAATDSNTLLSPRGQVTVDARTNSLLIQDTPGKIFDVRKLIAQLDQPVRQVMIETRLVQATEDFSRSLGVKFGVKSNTIDNGVQVNQGATLGGAPIAAQEGLNINLPSTGAGGQSAGTLALTIARLGTGNLLGLELSALEAEGKGKIISSPRLITANQKRASIEQGQERVFTTSVLGVGSVVTKKATLKLEVTPQITPDDRVNIDVIITKDNFADAAAGLLNVKQIQTQVLLDNGETVVIGGVYEQEQNDSVAQVPLLGDIPVLGWLFKTKTVLDTKTELLIFLTPRILSDRLSVR